jgi:colicin import membrane protein
MRKLILAVAICAPLFAMAQNTWEAPQQSAKTVDDKYLVGAVPEENGKVVFKTTIEAPGKSADQIFDIIGGFMKSMTKEPNQSEQSRITVADTLQHQIIGSYQEWLVFKSTALVLDQTRFYYILAANCLDGKAEVSITNIFYLYEEERVPQQYKAEEWITDKWGLTKKQNKLSRVSGKFRRKTIDRKDYLFNKLESLLK